MNNMLYVQHLEHVSDHRHGGNVIKDQNAAAQQLEDMGGHHHNDDVIQD